MMPAMIAGPSDRRGDRKAFAGSRAKDARDAKKTDPDTSKTPHRTPPRSLEIAKDTPTGHLRGITAVDGYQGPTEIPAGADGERDLEAEAFGPRRSYPRGRRLSGARPKFPPALMAMKRKPLRAAKVAAQNAHAAPLALELVPVV